MGTAAEEAVALRWNTKTTDEYVLWEAIPLHRVVAAGAGYHFVACSAVWLVLTMR